MQGITTKFHFQRQKDQIYDITMGDRLCVDVGAVDKDFIYVHTAASVVM